MSDQNYSELGRFLALRLNQTALYNYPGTAEATKKYCEDFGKEAQARLHDAALRLQHDVKDTDELEKALEDLSLRDYYWNDETPESWLQTVIDNS